MPLLLDPVQTLSQLTFSWTRHGCEAHAMPVRHKIQFHQFSAVCLFWRRFTQL